MLNLIVAEVFSMGLFAAAVVAWIATAEYRRNRSMLKRRRRDRRRRRERDDAGNGAER